MIIGRIEATPAASAIEVRQETAMESEARTTESGDSAQEVPGVAAGLECRVEEEVHRGQPLQRTDVPSQGPGPRCCFGHHT